MTVTQQEKAARFRALHEGAPFVIPNPFDGGSARVLEMLGFQALATSSGAAAGALGRTDHHISREEALAHVRIIVNATDLPVSADFENCFGDDPATVAETIRLGAEAGLVGASVEDAPGDRMKPIYAFDLAVERVAAAVEAARSLNFPFTVSARTENWLRPDPNLDETVRRLRAFEEAGADVLFAPGLPDLASVKAVSSSLSKPVNFMVGIPGRSFSVAELADAGVRRISLATSLWSAAMAGMLAAAKEVKEHGTFDYVAANAPAVGEARKALRSD